MRKWIPLLGVILALQVALAAGLYVRRDTFGTFISEERMISFEASEVDALRIEDGEGKSLILEREDGAWVIPAMDGFPADGEAVEKLLRDLEGLARGWPVATTSGAAARFKVADKSFERKLTLSREDTPLASFFVGTSPGLGKVHVRLPGEDPVYAVELNTYEMEADREDWIDKSVVSLEEEDISVIRLPNLALVREGEAMVPDDLAESEEAVEAEIDRLVERVAGLKIREVLGREEKAEYRRGEPALEYTVQLVSGESREFVFSRPADEDYYVLKTSAREEFFSVDSWTVDRIKEAERSELVRKKTEGRRGEEAGGPAPSPGAEATGVKSEGP